ncbi:MULTISPECIES: DUF2651 domain-containing protein [Bacillus]|uniref:DUF2651 domain-containing protein n=1 Tax=Bacillus TaxID=1386 RepID=UPI000AF159AD
MAVFVLFVVFGFPIISVLIGIFGTMLLKNVWMPTLIVLLARSFSCTHTLAGMNPFSFGSSPTPSLRLLLHGLQK